MFTWWSTFRSNGSGMDYDLEEELLAIAGRSRPPTNKKRGRKAESSDEEYGKHWTKIMCKRCWTPTEGLPTQKDH